VGGVPTFHWASLGFIGLRGRTNGRRWELSKSHWLLMLETRRLELRCPPATNGHIVTS